MGYPVYKYEHAASSIVTHSRDPVLEQVSASNIYQCLFKQWKLWRETNHKDGQMAWHILCGNLRHQERSNNELVTFTGNIHLRNRGTWLQSMWVGTTVNVPVVGQDSHGAKRSVAHGCTEPARINSSHGTLLTQHQSEVSTPYSYVYFFSFAFCYS
jgi:hypothetical protein